MNKRPDFIYIGTSKAGSTWLFDLLARHPDVYVAPTKGTYFFDHHFEKGWDWYLQHFSGSTNEKKIAEISHSYLYSKLACERLYQMDPKLKLMVCLRNPVLRAYSMYLDGVRNGKWSGTFEQRIEDTPEVFEQGKYAEYLEPYFQRFPREQIHVFFFDELQSNPAAFANDVLTALDVNSIELPAALQTKVMPAGVPRLQWACDVAKTMSRSFRNIGLNKIRGRVKRSRMIRNILYRPLDANEQNRISSETLLTLRERYRPSVERLDCQLGTDLIRQWGFVSECQVA